MKQSKVIYWYCFREANAANSVITREKLKRFNQNLTFFAGSGKNQIEIFSGCVIYCNLKKKQYEKGYTIQAEKRLCEFS